MSTSAAGSISLAAAYAADTLADCPAFQAWTESDDAAQARGRIHFDALPPPANTEEHTLSELQTYRPFALIAIRNFSRRQMSTGVHYEFGSEGAMVIEFFADVDAAIAHDPAEIAMRFNNAIGAIVDELCERAGLGGMLSFRRITMEEPATRTSVEEQEQYGDALMVRLTLEWDDNVGGGGA